jgi:hypothetical protein
MEGMITVGATDSILTLQAASVTSGTTTIFAGASLEVSSVSVLQ